MAHEMAKDIANDMTKKQTLETAKKMYENGIDISLIKKCTGLEETDLKQVLN